MHNRNFIFNSDSYKLTHWNQYPKGTKIVYSYFESREGAEFSETVFFGLQAIIKQYLLPEVINIDVLDARRVAEEHFGNPEIFNLEGWLHLIEDHNCRLPLRIKAIAEGTPVREDNVLMTVENTCPECFWLTNFVESLLTHVWYPSTVATLSRTIKSDIARHLDQTVGNRDALPFMLHDFGYRGATSNEAAGMAGMAHLVNFLGTDTLLGMAYARDFYKSGVEQLGYSVPATEHSVMTSLGDDIAMIDDLLFMYPSGILSVVADSYNIYDFAKFIAHERRDEILNREGVFVLRPDSGDPSVVTHNVLEILYEGFSGKNGKTKRGYKTLPPQIKVLWGDGIDRAGLDSILSNIEGHGFAADNMVFGMGAGLVQKVNRDTQRFAFKCSAQYRAGKWHDIYKAPLHDGKQSKRGRLILFYDKDLGYITKRENGDYDCLDLVYLNGTLIRDMNFDRVRKNAELVIGK